MASHNKSAGIPIRASNGGLWIYRKPEEGKRYVVGIDSSEGVRGGDYACAAVLELESCEDVAWWHGLFDPSEWGRMNCRLGFHYQSACLAFETGPSTHGGTAAQQAVSLKYPNLYMRRKMDTIAREWTEKIGWDTKEGSKRFLLDRIRRALSDGTRINFPTLLSELKGAKVVDGGTRRNTIAFEDHDDAAMAYGIALCVRDDLYTSGIVPKAPAPRVSDPTELHWLEFERTYGKDPDPSRTASDKRRQRARRRRRMANDFI